MALTNVSPAFFMPSLESCKDITEGSLVAPQYQEHPVKELFKWTDRLTWSVKKNCKEAVHRQTQWHQHFFCRHVHGDPYLKIKISDWMHQCGSHMDLISPATTLLSTLIWLKLLTYQLLPLVLNMHRILLNFLHLLTVFNLLYHS